MEKVRVDERNLNVEQQPLIIRERKLQNQTDEEHKTWKQNRNQRKKRNKLRKEKSKMIEVLKLRDAHLHGEIEKLEKENEELLEEGRKRRSLKMQAAKKVVERVVIPSEPHSQKRIREDCVGDVPCSKRSRGQPDSNQPHTEYTEAKSVLDSWMLESEDRFAKLCSSEELKFLAEEMVAKKILFGNFFDNHRKG